MRTGTVRPVCWDLTWWWWGLANTDELMRRRRDALPRLQGHHTLNGHFPGYILFIALLIFSVRTLRALSSQGCVYHGLYVTSGWAGYKGQERAGMRHDGERALSQCEGYLDECARQRYKQRLPPPNDSPPKQQRRDFAVEE
ncbi:hypothetical protein CYLTODRAFT_58718 [Cylindrobasidium torrendii FP15055 ss-10]|uniref:Uncharacterized protein n=1 Tax=Cylindrobasidium torrendii FP15055 ss-10 TaxID=1314674 RepID=A0A0D7B523_9AGAR|nr:hypothetical protein CYLTODRAFT_58718 [Cylindrobasidium torrendii FP15055 ss-10]